MIKNGKRESSLRVMWRIKTSGRSLLCNGGDLNFIQPKRVFGNQKKPSLHFGCTFKITGLFYTENKICMNCPKTIFAIFLQYKEPRPLRLQDVPEILILLPFYPTTIFF